MEETRWDEEEETESNPSELREEEVDSEEEDSEEEDSEEEDSWDDPDEIYEDKDKTEKLYESTLVSTLAIIRKFNKF